MIEFDAVIDTEGYTWQATTDENGVLWLVADETVEVVINRAVVGGYVYPAYVNDAGQLIIEWED
ncbi:hypothetical protein ACFWD7_33370 [Streptomyces mirabilis]|uniref:hypothetical protein n=1 Tax=Streptomyces TaxID=1883 RepID=UPI0021BE86D5|nr:MULTISPECIES: hypothetical protein [Streptomyces]MCT9114064.1 hypothetical protein [Streptomyces mirabilis]